MKKHIVGTAHAADISSDLICGTITSVDPVKVTVDGNFVIDASRLIIPSALYGDRVYVDVDGVSYSGSVSGSISVGTHVCMMRGIGGGKYVIIGALGSEE